MKRYEAYKDSGVEWIGEIPANWKLRRLKLLGSTRSGMGNKKPDDFGTGRPFLSYKDVYSRESFTSATGLVESTSDDLERYSVLRGDAFFTGSSETVDELGFSSVCLATIPEATFNGFTIRFRPYGGELHPEFAAFLFRSDVFRGYLRQRDNSITRANLSQQTLGDALVVLPTIDEQMLIADYLDAKTAEIDALVADCEREVELLREYCKAVISEAVTKGLDPDAPMKDSGVEWIGEIPSSWAIVPFKAVGTVAANLQHPGDYPDLPQVSPDRIEKDSGRLLPCVSVSEIGVESDNHLFHAGDILYSKVRPALNKVTVAPFDGMCSADMYPINTSQNRRWLVYYMLSNAFMEQVIVSTDRVKMPKINKEELGAFKVVLPDTSAQSEIVDYLDVKIAAIDTHIESKQSMADKLREYRRSLISEAVTGKFKVPGV